MTLRDKAAFVARRLADNYDDRFWWKTQVLKFVVRPVHSVYPGYSDAIDVTSEEWDNLLVLDACRADLFEEVADLERFDDYRRVTSVGSMTREWTERNFAGRSFGDTVYVTANPFTNQVAGESFHELYSVWRERFDGDERTVLPGPVVDTARRASDEHPDKRQIVHFMQPHHPFVGHDRLRELTEWDLHAIAEDGAQPDHPHSPYEAVEMGLVDHDTVWDAYSDNLELGLDAALDLAADLDGRTVVTADHGNMLGERAWPVPMRIYGHPPAVRSPHLTRVPWAIIDGDRRETTDDGVRSLSEVDEERVQRRLKDLGYHE